MSFLDDLLTGVEVWKFILTEVEKYYIFIVFLFLFSFNDVFGVSTDAVEEAPGVIIVDPPIGK